MSPSSDRHGAVTLFAERPIRLDGFTFRPYGIEIIDQPTLEQWTLAMEVASATHEHAPYWVGELLAYADSREDWSERLDQAMTATGLSRAGLRNLASVVRRVAPETRALSPSVEHTRAVTSLEPDQQKHMLERATSQGWTSRELRSAVQAEKRAKVVLQGRAPTMWTVAVLVHVDMEAPTGHKAEQRATEEVRDALKRRDLRHCRVASARVVQTKAGK